MYNGHTSWLHTKLRQQIACKPIVAVGIIPSLLASSLIIHCHLLVVSEASLHHPIMTKAAKQRQFSALAFGKTRLPTGEQSLADTTTMSTQQICPHQGKVSRAGSFVGSFLTLRRLGGCVFNIIAQTDLPWKSLKALNALIVLQMLDMLLFLKIINKP